MRKLGYLLCLVGCLVLAGLNPAIAADAKEWTFMVYLDGDNDLEPESVNDFLEMATVGSNDKINIIVQYDRVGGYSTAYGDWKDTRRFLIKKGDKPNVTPLENMGEKNMGSSTTFREFITWAMTKYPAKKYALVAWNHGGGWRSRAAKAAKVQKAICWDETNNDDALFMKDFQGALKAAENAVGRKVDIIAFDACLMGMIEIATDMKDLASVMIGSEEVEPGAGWPYDRILSKLAANPAMNAKELATIVVDEYNTSYKGEDATVTQAAVELAKIADVNAAMVKFVGAANQWSAMKAARAATRTYSESDGYPHADLYHFMNLLSTKGVTDPKVLAAAEEVKTAVKAAVINTKNGSSRSNSNGLAIFFPKTKTDYNNASGSEYGSHDFSVATNWNAHLLKTFNPPADKPIDEAGGGTDEGTGAPAVGDGSGTARFSRKTPVAAGKKLTSVTLYFKATSDLSGGQVTIAIPSGWSRPSTSGEGMTVLTPGSTVSASMKLYSTKIVVNPTTLAKNKTFKIAYKAAIAPTKAGNYEFTVKTRTKYGTLKTIAVQPVLVVK